MRRGAFAILCWALMGSTAHEAPALDAVEAPTGNGEVIERVVAVVNAEVTLKRLYREDRGIRLQPANPSLQPRSYPAADVHVRGVIRGVIRRT